MGVESVPRLRNPEGAAYENSRTWCGIDRDALSLDEAHDFVISGGEMGMKARVGQNIGF